MTVAIVVTTATSTTFVAVIKFNNSSVVLALIEVTVVTEGTATTEVTLTNFSVVQKQQLLWL